METVDVDICMYNTLKTFKWHKDLNDMINQQPLLNKSSDKMEG